MSKPTLFIAVQCCQCSTMQVKQQKKSTNKWNCVVCNQKQSVKKVYAQGYQAKDIRNVVQSFNLSRKVDDDEEKLVTLVEELDDNVGENKANRRTDWSEYIEDESDNFEPSYLKSKFNEKEAVAEPKIVTEFTEDLVFKKPKLKGKFGSSFRSFGKDSYKPNLSKRVSAESRGKSSNHETFWDEDIVSNRSVRRKCEQQQLKVSTMMKTSASKWSHYMESNDISRNMGEQCEQQQQGPNKLTGVMKAGASKWNKYITDEENDHSYNGGEGLRQRPAFADDLSLMCGYNEPEGIDQLVEEDIHPDFM